MALHDIDANKPSGSIKIRVKTYAMPAVAAGISATLETRRAARRKSLFIRNILFALVAAV